MTLADLADARAEVLRLAEDELARRRANNPEDIARRKERKLQSTRGWIDEQGVLQGGLMAFIRHHWHVLEPQTELVEGWPLYAIVLHLEAVTFGEITRLLINVPPGFQKSLCTDVWWPAWEWGPMGMSHLRYVAFSYAATLTERDNDRFRELLISTTYRELWGQVFEVRKTGVQKITNDKTGWKFASSVGGVGTGERGDRVICFPAEVTVLTNRGWLEIGEIVRSKAPVSIAGYDEEHDHIEWQAVSAYETNPASEIIEVMHACGILRCTPDHPIFVVGKGYMPASAISPGDTLRVLRQDHSPQAKRTSEVLLSDMPVCSGVRSIEEGEQPTMQDLRQDGLSPSRSFGPDTSRSVLQPHMPWAVQHRQQQSRLSRGAEESSLRLVWEGKTVQGQRSRTRQLLFNVLRFASQVGGTCATVGQSILSGLRHYLQAAESQSCLLFAPMCQCAPLHAHEGQWQRTVCSRGSDEALSAWLEQSPQAGDTTEGRELLSPLWAPEWCACPSCSPHRLREGKPRSIEPDYPVQDLSRSDAWLSQTTGRVEISVVSSIRRGGRTDATFNLCVSPYHNYFAGGVLVHNCDDPNNVKDTESEQVRNETARWFRESMSNRLNDQEYSAIVVIMQRLHEEDVSGTILEQGSYTHLCIPLEYDSARHCTTSIGWTDPRSVDGEIAWPERLSAETVAQIRVDVGPYAFASQYAQEPAPRGGGIFQRDWWQIWEPGSEEAKAIAKHEEGKWPPFEYVVASLDGAYTEKEQNDPTAMTVWGIFRNKLDHPKIALVHAWRKRLIVHGPIMKPEAGESRLQFLRRAQPHWGVVEWAAHTCRMFKVDLLLIEAKASGISVAQSIQSLYGDEGFATQLEPVKGDKMARAQAIVPFFSNHMVYAPAAPKDEMPGDILLFRDWAQMVIDEMAVFPKGRYDDLTDTASQALRHLRVTGFARMEAEVETDKANAMRYKPRTKALYPGSRV